MPNEITIEQLAAEAAQLEQQAAAAREALRLKRLEISAGSEHQLAAQLHQLLAKHPSSTICTWDYELIDGAPDWTATEHAAWLAFAQLFLTAVNNMGGTPAQVLTMLAFVENNRPR